MGGLLSGAGLLAASLLLLAAGPCHASRCYLNFSPDAFPSCRQLSPNVSMHWAVAAGQVTFALDVDGEWSWVGLGLSEGGMLGADMAVAALTDGGGAAAGPQWLPYDYWSEGFAFPQLDAQQDVALVSVTRAHGNTLVALRRPLVSCDAQDRPVLNDTRQTLVFAYGTGPFAYHGPANRGQAEVVLLPAPGGSSSGGGGSSVMPGGKPLQVLDLLMPAYTIPSDPTTYACVNVAMPTDAKYHIYRYEPVIDNTPYVHHFVAYICPGTGAPPTAVGVPYDCLERMECEEFYIGWAPGLAAVDAPASAALAFGAGSTAYVALQIHYTNLAGARGQVDSSGLRLYYSPVLKQYDMGVLTLGSVNIAVPPGAAPWTTAASMCPAACTAKIAAGAEGLTLVDSFYHMHQQGRSMLTRHVRGGAELPPLGRRDHFAFDYQTAIAVPPDARQLLPGDTLITTCTFDGAGRTNTTYFGLASYDEMCFNFLTYYPYNAAITQCLSDIPNLPDLAGCATSQQLDSVQGEEGVKAAQQAGWLIPVPPGFKFKPYQPTCARTAPASGASTPPPPGPHHSRNVGGAVAAILIVTAVGGTSIWAVMRAMRRKRQAEEEQHLFEKYNPNSASPPAVAGVGGITNSSSAGHV